MSRAIRAVRVVEALPADDQVLAELIRSRFHGLPPSRRLVRYDDERWDVFGRTFPIDVQDAHALGRVRMTADRSAVALWMLHPPVPEPDPAPDPRITEAAGIWAPRFHEFAVALHRHRRELLDGQPHLHLWILATSQDRQGEGLASALILDQLAWADAEGIAVYLEAASFELIAFYERFGFAYTGEPVDVGDGVLMYPMIRPSPASR
jgi:GNAT superfamily N-acetyltransferase